jgi:hypothetical protein
MVTVAVATVFNASEPTYTITSFAAECDTLKHRHARIGGHGSVVEHSAHLPIRCFVWILEAPSQSWRRARSVRRCEAGSQETGEESSFHA